MLDGSTPQIEGNTEFPKEGCSNSKSALSLAEGGISAAVELPAPKGKPSPQITPITVIVSFHEEYIGEEFVLIRDHPEAHLLVDARGACM